MDHPTTIDAYIAGFPAEEQQILQKIRRIIAEVVPNATETISYGVPTIKLQGTYVVYFAGYAQHVSIYPILHEDPELMQEIEPYRSGRGTLKFPLNKPIPYELIKKVVQSLLREHQHRTRR